MSKATLSLIGLSEYMIAHNKDLFELLELPEGIEKDTLTDNILLRSAELEVLYTDPEYMRLAIGVWSKKHARTFDRWIKALQVEYNPLENYDRIEEWTDTGTASGNATSISGGNSFGSVEDKRSAFDSNTYQNNALNTNTSHTDSNITSNTDNQNENKHTGRLHGNIGVTTSQQMLQSELDIAKWNIYEQITDLFISEFIILVY